MPGAAPLIPDNFRPKLSNDGRYLLLTFTADSGGHSDIALLVENVPEFLRLIRDTSAAVVPAPIPVGEVHPTERIASRSFTVRPGPEGGAELILSLYLSDRHRALDIPILLTFQDVQKLRGDLAPYATSGKPNA